MAKALSQQDVHQLALVGARARLDALQAEMKALIGSFPELAGGRVRRVKAAAPAPTAARRRKRRYSMTAEQKQAVSERMKKYWASRRKEKNR